MVITSNLLQTFALLVHVLVFVQMNDISLNSFVVIFFLLRAFWFNGNYFLPLSQLRMPLICFSRKSGIVFYLWFSRGWRGIQQSLIRGGSAPRSDPLPFYILFVTEKFGIYLLLTNGAPFTYQVNPFTAKCSQRQILTRFPNFIL